MRIWAPLQAPSTPATPSRRPGRRYDGFGWLYGDLPPCAPLPDSELLAIARAMTAVAPAAHGSLPAAYTYFGQLVAHDVTIASSTSGDLGTASKQKAEFRTPALDLDAIYGRGPFLQPYLYERYRPARLLVSNGVSDWEYDLPRNPQQLALTADPRNDETLLLSQLVVPFLLFHNRCVEQMEASGAATEGGVFQSARQLTRWHYQWVVLHDYLPRILHPDTLARLAGATGSSAPFTTSTLRHFDVEAGPWVPLEFAAAAFRFGHTLIREGYHLNTELKTAHEGREVPLFSASEDDLRGKRRLPAGWRVEWLRMMLPGGDSVQTSGAFDTHLARPLGQIPIHHGVTLDLAHIDLELGQAMSLPCGQAMARRMGVEDVLAPEETGLDGSAARETPLWYYVLREAEVRCRGKTLGRVGSEIVGEVLLGLIRADPDSYLSREPDWRPPSQKGSYGLRELVQAGYPR